VWQFDHAETILGASILHPVLDVLSQRPGFSAWRDDLSVDMAITSLLEHATKLDVSIVSMDYSGFDSSVSASLIHIIFELLRYWFAERDVLRLNLLESVFTSSGLVCPDGMWLGRDGSVPSGSALTNLIDSLVNLVAGLFVARVLGVQLVRYEVLGDDSVFLFSRSLPGAEISQAVKELGLETNPDKVWVSKESAHYLQRLHSINYQIDGVCRGVRSLYRTLSGMMSYERWTSEGWSGYMDTARWIMQAENARWHPRFRDFVRFMRAGDRILLSGLDPVEIFKRAGGSDKVRSVLSIASFPFNVQNPEGVNSFVTTRFLRSLKN
jgi:hypothetical protein